MNLTSKGVIKGRAAVISEAAFVVVIGGILTERLQVFWENFNVGKLF